MQKFAVQAIRVALALCMADSAAAAAVSSNHDTALFGHLGGAANVTAVIPLSGASMESRGGLVRATTSRSESGSSAATPSTSGANTAGMLIAAMAIMGVVVRRRWDTR